MIECMIIGDSIAVGTHMFRKECVLHAKGGITSHGWAKTFSNIDLKAKTVIISLGTNDWEKADTLGKLKEIRSKINAEQVFWIAPHSDSRNKAHYEVLYVSDIFDDAVISTHRYQADKVHPSWAGYKELVEQTKQKNR